MLGTDNPFYVFYGVTLTPNLTPNLGSFLLLKESSFYSQSGVKITPKMGLTLLLTWVIFTLFGVTLTLKPRETDATLMDVTCCVRLHTLLHVVGCCCVLLRKV